jgi:hypothetical protein
MRRKNKIFFRIISYINKFIFFFFILGFWENYEYK